MKAALLIVLSLSALAFAGPAYNKNTNNQIEANQQQQQQQQQYMTSGAGKQTQAVETLKQWCFSSQMSQPELTASFKKLVNVVKSSPQDQSTEAAVMSERICQGALVQKSAQSGETYAQNGADAQAHELIKDVYMDALIACESHECMQQLVKIINSNKVDTIRASYYMTRIAVTEKDSIKDDNEVKQMAETFINSQGNQQQASEAVERQKLFAATSLLGKALKDKCDKQQEQQHQSQELKQAAEQVAKTIVERYIKPVSQQEVQQYQQQSASGQQQSQQTAKKIAKRNAALQALSNIPGCVLNEINGIEETLVELAQNKQEQSTTRQSAIECLEQNDSAEKPLKQITFDEDEPIEVRVAAFRALMTTAYAGKNKDEQTKQQMANEIVDQVVKHCENQRNQQQDDQFVLYAISYLDNLRTSQQPEHEAIKESIAKNKQHYMQIQLLNKKFKPQLSNIRKSSRNYKLEQEFNQLDSGLVIEGDVIYESKHQQQSQQQQQQQPQILPKLVRVNMSMPVMGETVNVVEITLRQDQMDEELLGALKLVQNTKFNSESMSKVVDSFKSSVEQQQQKQQQQQQQQQQKQRQQQYGNKQQQQAAEADLTIKVDGCTVIYVSTDDFKASSSSQGHQRNARSAGSYYGSSSIVDDIIEHLRRKPVSFNRGFNFNVNKRFSKVLDVEANIVAGLRLESRASGQSSKDFEIATHIEPRFAFESIVGPAKMSNKKLLQRVSTKTALGLRLRYKSGELVDVQVDLPMNTMELFTVEAQMVEKSSTNSNSYTYLPESIYGQEDIYSPDDDYVSAQWYKDDEENDDDDDDNQSGYATGAYKQKSGMRKMKRSIFESSKKSSASKSIAKFMQGKQRSSTTFAYSSETPTVIARAIGLRNKLRVVASPKDMSFLVQAVAQKYEPSMQGYRVQVQKNQRSGEQKQYILTVSTPGSRTDRTMQVRVISQSNSQRTVIKSDIQSPKMSATAQCELVHDGRQYSVKAEVASGSGRGQWRHNFEAGVQRGSQSQSGRIATTYKPYVNIDSSELKRPVQMQGVVSYQQSPKTVISYDLKSPSSGDYAQGKIILDQRSSYASNKRAGPSRRSMQSPIETLLDDDLTLTAETVAQIGKHAIKAHQMTDWNAAKWAINADLSVSHKNMRKQQQESQLAAALKLDEDQQMLTVQRNSPQQERKEFRLTVASDTRSPNAHQFVAEYRYNGKRASNLNSVVSYKHKVDVSQYSAKKVELGYSVELVASESQINEKISGRTQVNYEKGMKAVHSEMSSSRGKSAKIDVEYVSAQQHQVEVNVQTQSMSHRTSVRSNQRQTSMQSRTEKDNQMVASIEAEVDKQQDEAKLVVDMPTEKTHVAVDLKLSSGKLSSVAVQTPRFASKAEFAFDSMSRSYAGNHLSSIFKKSSPFNSLRLKGDLKDAMKQEAYWIESAWNAANSNSGKSFLRFDSPAYRTDLEYDAREQSAKFGSFARSKRSANYNQLYSNEESLLGQAMDSKLNLANKLWMVRSAVSSPRKVDELKQKARRALFEYADRSQSHKHSLNWSPSDERVNFSFERQPNTGRQQQAGYEPMRFTGDLSTSLCGQQQRPSTLSMSSKFVDFDFDASPYDGQESYAKLRALSRHPRSPFKKHESEIRYKKEHGYKANMKHEDSKGNRHSYQAEADESPKKWAKMSYDSDKYGKGEYEHQWRKQSGKSQAHNDDTYQNKIYFSGQSPSGGEWSHRSTFQWEEPTKMMVGGRVRRSIGGQRRYSTMDYLKHINSARLNSQTYGKANAELYNLDFDYQPESRCRFNLKNLADQYGVDFDYAPDAYARLNVNMPNDLMHSSNIEYEPTERLYKFQSKLYNSRTSQPSYELLASTKPMIAASLAGAQQEALFINEQHPMLARPIAGTLGASLFKQPLKIDYTDKYGRIARVDYDQSPLSGAGKYAGLRQKRAALYYKDAAADFEHQSSFDFYPEAMLGFAKSQRASGDVTIKAQTKYGPIVMQVDSDEKAVELDLKSPVFSAKLTGETSSAASNKRGAENVLIKLTVDNKQQRAQLSKIVRNSPILREIETVQQLAKQIDQARFEHQSELLIVEEAIYKIKSQTMMNQRPVMSIEGELNDDKDMAYMKIKGERSSGQLTVDMETGSASLTIDDKNTKVQHQTRLDRLNDKFYALESMTTYKQQPLLKLSGKVESKIITDPGHLFEKRRSGKNQEEHISTFEAIVYEPKPIQIAAQFNCLEKEARIVLKDMQDKQVQETVVKYDDQTDSILVDARQSSSNSQVFTSQARINLSALAQPNKCRGQSCQSEFSYAQKSGAYAGKYMPGEYISITTPSGKQFINLPSY